MVFLSLQSLLDLCSIRIAYLMWTRRDVVKQGSEEDLYDELVEVVLADVQGLPLPKLLKLRVLDKVKPTGKRLLSLLNLWRSKTLPENGQKWLTSDMLSYCLILNADGLINQRKTAEKILSSRMLHSVFAFRFACVNFLENEVLKLWMFVKQHLLNKIILEGEQPLLFESKYSFRRVYEKEDPRLYGPSPPHRILTARMPPFPCTTEPDEVLFWVSSFLSKENAINIKEVPHFMGFDVDWYEFSVKSAAVSGNVACYDYFKNLSKRKVGYSHTEIIKGILQTFDKNRQQPGFIFHFMLLDLTEKKELLRLNSFHMLPQFLQWPLSQTFAEDPEGLMNIMPDVAKDSVLLKILAVLFHENIFLNPILDTLEFRTIYTRKNNLICSDEHLKIIWIALWEISSRSEKLIVLNSLVFKSIVNSRRHRGFRTYFTTSGLKEKLLRLFLTNGEAVLELFENENMKQSLKSLVAKYMPEDFPDLKRRCISFLKTPTVQYRMEMKREIKMKLRWEDLNLINEKSRSNPVNENFLTYIRNFFNGIVINESVMYKKAGFY